MIWQNAHLFFYRPKKQRSFFLKKSNLINPIYPFPSYLILGNGFIP